MIIEKSRKYLISYLLEFLLIFFSVIGSLFVANYIQEKSEDKRLVDSLMSLKMEVEANIQYGKEYSVQLQNMSVLTEQLVFPNRTLNFEELKSIHSDNPFINTLTSDGSSDYLINLKREEVDFLFLWVLSWEPQDIYYESIKSGGNLLLLEDKDLVRKLDFSYNKQFERINGFSEFRKQISDALKNDSFSRVRNGENISKTEYFLNYSSNDYIQNLLIERLSIINLSILSVEEYMNTLREINDLLDLSINKIL